MDLRRTGEWRRLHNEELYYLYFSLDIIRVITLRRLRWAWHVECIRERCIQGFNGEISGKETTLNPGVEGRIILKSILKKWIGGMY